MVQASDLLTRQNTELCFDEKITKCEWRTIKTMLNNSFVKESVFYHLNE